VIRFEDVSFGYAGQDQKPPVFAGLGFAVARGEWVCVLGESGCGKTTLLGLAAGFLRPGQGRVLCDGREVRAPGPDRGVVFQEPTLFPWLTVRGNVEFGLRRRGLRGAAARRAALAEIARMGLAAHAEAYPHALSGGMRQRAAIARVLALSPSVLLLDEPFSALDIPTRERLQDELAAIWAATGATVLYVTHSVEEAALLGDRVLVLAPCGKGIFREVPLALPRPRRRLAGDVLAVEARLRELMRASLATDPVTKEALCNCG
jgi:NitT/TauT family transport system ATP-binding protein